MASTSPGLGSIEELTDVLTDVADPDKAGPMAAYMKDHFAYLGVSAGNRRTAAKAWTSAAKTIDVEQLLEFAVAAWESPYREVHYVAMDSLRAGAKNLEPDDLDVVRSFIELTPWWDTVDSLAVHTVGTMVRNYPELGDIMDEWIHDPNLWIVRSAILHQLMFKEDTDEERLFRYCEWQADHPDFFIRKAIGWALRQYGRVAPSQVRAFVDLHTESLSGLTVREALKHL